VTEVESVELSPRLDSTARTLDGSRTSRLPKHQRSTRMPVCAMKTMTDSGRQGRKETLNYIGELTSELATMASTARCEYLAHLLNLARIEAEENARQEAGCPNVAAAGDLFKAITRDGRPRN
jgi:hypothetical protein